jgi:hypothetical protein
MDQATRTRTSCGERIPNSDMSEQPTEFEVALDQTATPEQPPSDCEALDMLLAESGVYATRKLILRLNSEVDRRGLRIAGEMLRVVAFRLEGTPPGEALLREIGCGTSLRKAAVKCGITGPGIVKAQRKIRKRLSPPGILV